MGKEEIQMAHKHMSEKSPSLGKIYKLNKNEMPFSSVQVGEEKTKCWQKCWLDQGNGLLYTQLASLKIDFNLRREVCQNLTPLPCVHSMVYHLCLQKQDLRTDMCKNIQLPNSSFLVLFEVTKRQILTSLMVYPYTDYYSFNRMVIN